jgi:hypothetical protein
MEAFTSLVYVVRVLVVNKEYASKVYLGEEIPTPTVDGPIYIKLLTLSVD